VVGVKTPYSPNDKYDVSKKPTFVYMYSSTCLRRKLIYRRGGDAMIILPTDELNRFRIKQLTKEINQQLKEWKEEETLKLKFLTVREAWGDLLAQGIDDDTLYRYRVRLEREYYSST
jgi:hypothetical protein